MENKSKEDKIKLKELVLDTNNPRFAELYTGNNNEEELITYLLYNEAAIDVAKAIVKSNEYYQDRPLWVIEKEGKYLVKDGNRRCAAVKALQLPGKYEIDLPKTDIPELPVLIYKNEEDVNERIFQEHANSLFRSWERIAKALEVYRLFKIGNTVSSMKEIDSSPAQLIKLASFYYEAVKIGGDDFKNLLTRGRGRTGGRAIIFERLFNIKYTQKCGYHFKSNPNYEIVIDDTTKFNKYVSALIHCLKDDVNYEIKTDTVDLEKEAFFKRLKIYGFDYFAKATVGSSTNNNGQTSGTSNSGTADSSSTNNPNSGSSSSGGSQSSNSGNGSTKKYPILKRKALPPGLKGRVVEYFKLDPMTCPNSKIAMARVTFECVLKYVVEQTKYNGKTTMNKSIHFQNVYPPNKYANFDLMKTKFTEIIKANVDKNSFNSFNLMTLHQLIHNYKVNGVPANGDNISHNLLELIEFMLQDETDLLNSLDLTKL
ncbi:hypothetical protein [Flavobacterium phycosphaerae]|uniref:hypothetical protein n=1 Tax=Flavobacterium phycosphaerae TaxID=2697515 RepID=UPI00138AE85E|nr:hypothetical protein [Flavobacterium phycosphaerae]